MKHTIKSLESVIQKIELYSKSYTEIKPSEKISPQMDGTILEVTFEQFNKVINFSENDESGKDSEVNILIGVYSAFEAVVHQVKTKEMTRVELGEYLKALSLMFKLAQYEVNKEVSVPAVI